MPRGASRNAARRGPSTDVIVRAFDRAVAREPEAALVQCTAWRATRGNIRDGSLAVASCLEAAGLAPGAVVGLQASQAPAFLASFIGLRRQHCTALLIDEAAPDDYRARVYSSLGAVAVLRCDHDAGSMTLRPVVTRVGGSTEALARPDWAVIKLTSGSTGQPRGVAVTAQALLADEAALASTMGIRDDDRLVAALPLSHSYGFSSLAMAALVRGVQLLVPADDGPFAPLNAARDGEATVFPTVPAYLQALLRMSQPPAWPPSVRLVITAGAPLPPDVARKFREVTGRRIHVFYGSSECGGICYDRVGDAGERGTVGTPVDGVSITLSPVNDTPKTGLLSVRSAAVADTYVPDGDSRLADGQFITADLAAWRGAEVALLGRVDRTINVRGFKVSPAEVEQVIAGLTGADEVFVLDVPGPDGVGTIVRAVVGCRDGSLNAASVSAWCRTRLAEHKVPRSIVLVEALPRTPRGKIDRDAVAALPGAVPRHG